MTSFKTLTAASIVALAALVGGCTHTNTTSPIVVSNESTGIVVNGRGEIDVVPNVAVVNLGIEAHGATVAEARNQAAAAAENLHDSLRKNGIAAEDIKTTDLSISPRYDYRNDGSEPKIIGYTVTNTVTVKVRRMADASRVIDDAVDAGGNMTRMNGIFFEIAEAKELREQARAKAVQEARRKAEQLAALSGVELGIPISVEEVSVNIPMPPGRYMMDGAAEATPIEPGTATVSVDVRVRWAIGGS